MRSGRTMLLLGMVLLVAMPSALAEVPELALDVYPDKAPTYQGPEDTVELTQERPREAYAWSVNLTEEYTVAEVRLHQAFPVERGLQVVPLVDGKHFTELTTRDPAEVDHPARVYNLTGEQGNWTYRLGLPGPGEVNLSLHVDDEPPTFEVDPAENITHFSFDVVSRTSEPALADLVIDGPDRQRVFPTNQPGVWQRFPVQGLNANTTYTYHITFWDWSKNEATSEPVTLTTAPEPELPEPSVIPLTPGPNSTVAPENVFVEARFESPGSPVLTEDVRLFFDKEEVARSAFTVDGTIVTYQVPGPLEPRTYFVTVEVTNQAGGVGSHQWSFEVEAPQQAPGLGAVAAVLASLGALAILRCRGPRAR